MCDLETEFYYQGAITTIDDDCVAEGYSVAKEIDELPKFQQVICDSFGSGLILRPYLEGFVVRIYYFEDNWFISTNKCLDAYTSNYNSEKSFGDMFEEILKSYIERDYVENDIELDIEKGLNLTDEFLGNLDKECCYFILVGHPELKTTIKINSPYMYLLYATKYIDGCLNIINNIPFIPSIHNISCSSMNKTSIENENKGFVLETYNRRYVWFKPSFKYIRKRNSHKSMASFILDLMDDKKQCQEYFEIYPEHQKYLQEINDAKVEFCKEAHQLYITRHIRKTFIETSNKSLHYFVSDKANENNLFAIYLQKRQRMFLDDIIRIFDEYPRTSKFIFLRSFLETNDILKEN